MVVVSSKLLIVQETRYNFTSTIIPWRSLIFLSFQNSLMDYAFLFIVYYSLKCHHISSEHFSYLHRAVKLRSNFWRKYKDSYFSCVLDMRFEIWLLCKLFCLPLVFGFPCWIHVWIVDWRYSVWKFSGFWNCLGRMGKDQISLLLVVILLPFSLRYTDVAVVSETLQTIQNQLLKYVKYITAEIFWKIKVKDLHISSL